MNDARSDTYISVVGPGRRASAEELALAEEVGRLLAEAGAVVVCGGLGGVMEAVAKGARAKGGTVIGILPGASRTEGNHYLSVSIPTDMDHGRNVMVVGAGDAVIAVGGEYGTLSEIGLALKMGKPVVGLGTWDLSKGGVRREVIEQARDPAEAVRRVLALARHR
jgi:uncharacterized protein (TIGR00725 family)